MCVCVFKCASVRSYFPILAKHKAVVCCTTKAPQATSAESRTCVSLWLCIICLAKYLLLYLYEQNNEEIDGSQFVFPMCICACGQDVAAYSQPAFHWDVTDDYKTHHVALNQRSAPQNHGTQTDIHKSDHLQLPDQTRPDPRSSIWAKLAKKKERKNRSRGYRIISNLAVKQIK